MRFAHRVKLLTSQTLAPWYFIWIVFCLTTTWGCGSNEAYPQIIVGSVIEGKEGMVVSAHELASRAGAEVLVRGGNAVDAAIATAFAITVVEPNMSSLGGEGYMIISPREGRSIAIDFRSLSPGRVNVYTDPNQIIGPQSVCIPGLVAGLIFGLENYGTMHREEILAPAISLASNGFPLGRVLHEHLAKLYEYTDPESDAIIHSIYFKEGCVPSCGTILVNKPLGRALELIANKGARAFYYGEISNAIVETMVGFLTTFDLQRYRAVVRDPVVSKYRGYTLISAPPIGAGVAVAEALGILQQLEPVSLAMVGNWYEAEVVHLTSQALLLASADRMAYVGDPDFYDIPVQELTCSQYTKTRAKLVQRDQAFSPTWSTPVGDPYSYAPFILRKTRHYDEELSSTTHISVLDKDGCAVSITQTLSSSWGSRVMVPGYGFFMNNELRNFNAYDSANPNDLNVIGPYKRPRTVLSPSVVKYDNGDVFLVVGTPGSGCIPSSVLETIINVIDFGLSLEESVKAPKFCSLVTYKKLHVEGGYSAHTINSLSSLGHEVKAEYEFLDPYFGGINAILQNKNGVIVGVGTPRRHGAAATPNSLLHTPAIGSEHAFHSYFW